MRTFEIMFSDLTPEAQKRYLEFQKVSDPSELNWEISPLATIDVEDETGTEGQDRANYTDTQDREDYIPFGEEN